MKFLKKLCIVTIVFCFGTETFAEEWNVSVWGKRRAFTEHIEKLAELDEVIEIKTLIRHPMHSGRVKDVDGKTIPRLIINKFNAMFNASCFFCFFVRTRSRLRM